MKINIDFTDVGGPSKKQWELIFDIEYVLKVKFNGDTFQEASDFISEYIEQYKGLSELIDCSYEQYWKDY